MQRLTDRALALWPGLAEQMGVPAQAWRVTPLARREDAHVAMVALRLDRDGRALVLKLQAAPQDRDGFAAACRAHLHALARYPEGVPVLHAVDPDAQAVVMDFAEGPPLASALEGCAMPDQQRLLRRAGAWLDGFHRATLDGPRRFQPRFTMAYLRQIVAEVESGARAVAEPAAFLGCARAFSQTQASYEGQDTVAARTHGDLHMRNILIGPRVKGIDFVAERDVPVGHDIGRLLADYAILRAPHAAIPRGEALPRVATQAFFDGYRLVGPDDPSVRLLIRHRVLAEWWGLPADASQRSCAQARRLQGILTIVQRLFNDA